MDSSLFNQLQERAKELRCLYRIEEVLQENKLPLGKVFYKALEIMPDGWQFPGICMVRIEYKNSKYSLSDFQETKWLQSADIIVDNCSLGSIKVYYRSVPEGISEIFLPEEQKLLNTIADRLSYFIFQKRIEKILKYLTENGKNIEEDNFSDSTKDAHWKWRLNIATIIAEKTNFDIYGIKAMYIIGSTKNRNAGPASDIDLMVHFAGTEKKGAFYVGQAYSKQCYKKRDRYP